MPTTFIYCSYLAGGAIMFAISMYLHIYYQANANKCKPEGSRFFRALSYVFIGSAYLGIIWCLAGIIALTGHRELYTLYIPYLTALAVYIYIFTLFWFLRATNKE